MKVIKVPFYLLYKLYYILVFIAIFIILLPFFLFSFYIFKSDKFIYKLHWIWAKLLNILTLIKLKIVHQHQPPQGPFIIISNHSSFLDVFLMCLIFPNNPLVFMAKAELLKIPLFGLLFKYYHIPVFRNNRKKSAEALVKCEKSIDRGLSVIIFPEGGIFEKVTPRMAPFKNGAFKMAKDKQIPIVPITFMNNFELIGEPSEFFSVARPGIARVVMHPTVTVEEINNLDLTALREKCYHIIEKPLKEKYNF